MRLGFRDQAVELKRERRKGFDWKSREDDTEANINNLSKIIIMS
jgi:hypothetical protein